jgi:hypothetical protein
VVRSWQWGTLPQMEPALSQCDTLLLRWFNIPSLSCSFPPNVVQFMCSSNAMSWTWSVVWEQRTGYQLISSKCCADSAHVRWCWLFGWSYSVHFCESHCQFIWSL